ncbi:ABC transporter permease [Colwellia sp. 75C3]|uniref:ABC transporter permease n=1 Tax=Colwellia sp. 75C3 TaxID=888425 RepID=UPI000C31C3A6|nr:ABC transporter permease [Colwellia sp. 75C3]PKG82163.1 ABC transporter permease [Colwellia sp. 75C3]
MGKLLFIVAWRNFCRDKLTSFIQLTGLIIGIASFILIQFYVDHQKSYNTAFTDAKDIYRINLIRGENKPQAQTPLRLAKELTQNFTEVEDATRISPSSVSVKHLQGVYSERALYADANYLDFFDFQLIEGDVNTALDAPDSLLLHQDLAIKYFSTTVGVIGKRLTINGKEHQVTGVVKKPTTPTTMPLTMILPMENFYGQLSQEWIEAWNFNATRTYTKIRQPANINTLIQTVSDYYDSRAKGLSSFKTNRVIIQPLLDIYLDNTTTSSLTPPSSEVMVTVFSIISFMILLLACVNFTNLSTAAAMSRGKDVGVRKALGASKIQLVTQYLSEAVMLSALACMLALVLVYLCLPAFNQLMTAEMVFNVSIAQLLQLLALTLLVGVLAGSYPAFYLSNLSPAHVLKGLVSTSKSGVLLRQSLIILQFAIAAFLLVASLVVNWQMQYIKNMEQGFNREGVIVVSRGDNTYNAFKSQALRHPDITSVTMSHTVPTKATRTSNTVRRLDDITNEIWVGNNPVSLDFFKTYGIKVLSGRIFSKAYVNDAYKENKDDWQSSIGKLVINQTLAATLGWSPEEAVGQLLTLGGGQDGLHNHQIIGVVEDSHYVNVKNTVAPMTYVLSAEPKDLSLRWTSIRFKVGTSLQSLKEVEQIWLGLAPNLAFKYDWITDLFDSSYRNENQQTEMLNVFTLLAIVVTAIGLFGLAAFNTQRRVKEIAVRKILGASTGQLCFMLVNQFSSLVIISNVIALPLAYFLMRDWLDNFIYRIDMPYSAFILSAVFSLVIAYITVMVIAYRAATAKPVDSLHCE